MLDASILNEMYSKIQKQLFYMIPEKWDKIYLYASVIDQINNLRTGEMFFYYFPKGVLRKNPINVYEVPNKFNIDEITYFALADKLYGTVKELREIFEQNENEVWSNITISIENCKFSIEYNYENLLGSHYSSYDRHIIWKNKYLKIPIERFSKKDRSMVEQYILEGKFRNSETKIDVQNVYNQKINNIIDYNKEQKVISKPQNIKEFVLVQNKYTKEIPLNQIVGQTLNREYYFEREDNYFKRGLEKLGYYKGREETKEEQICSKNQILNRVKNDIKV